MALSFCAHDRQPVAIEMACRIGPSPGLRSKLSDNDWPVMGNNAAGRAILVSEEGAGE